MSPQVPSVLREHPRTRLAIDAAYFVIRVLRNASRDFEETPISMEPSLEVNQLAQRAVEEIEEFEGGEAIPDFEEDTLLDYILLLGRFQREVYLEEVGREPERAASILKEMRASD